MDPAAGEIDGEIAIAEGDLSVRRKQLADPGIAVPPPVGIDHQVLAVGERGGQPAIGVEVMEPGG